MPCHVPSITLPSSTGTSTLGPDERGLDAPVAVALLMAPSTGLWSDARQTHDQIDADFRVGVLIDRGPPRSCAGQEHENGAVADIVRRPHELKLPRA